MVFTQFWTEEPKKRSMWDTAKLGLVYVVVNRADDGELCLSVVLFIIISDNLDWYLIAQSSVNVFIEPTLKCTI